MWKRALVVVLDTANQFIASRRQYHTVKIIISLPHKHNNYGFTYSRDCQLSRCLGFCRPQLQIAFTQIASLSLVQLTKHPPWRPPSGLRHEAPSENNGNRQAASKLMRSQINHQRRRSKSWVLLIQRSCLYLLIACLRNGLPLPTGSRARYRLLPTLPFLRSLLPNLEALLFSSLI
jgi:hypothetical protein